MRTGWNPNKSQKFIDAAADITVGIVNHVPTLTGYHREGLEVLKLCLASIRATADRPFDLIVVDNASCAEVLSFLHDEYQARRIDHLILNARNVGENALLQFLAAAPGDYVFYSDGDIYHRPGWMQAHIELSEAFPEAGFIGGRPIRLGNQSVSNTLSWIEAHANELSLEKGHLIPKEWLLDFARTVGGHISHRSAEEIVEKWTQESVDLRVSRNGATAYVGASHMQFMTRQKALKKLSLAWTETKFVKRQSVEDPLDRLGYLRLSTEKPYVDHIGNSIQDEFLRGELERLTGAEFAEAKASVGSAGIWHNPLIRRAMLRIYKWAFELYERGNPR